MALGTPIIGTIQYSALNGTTVACNIPTGVVGDILVLVLGMKPATANGGSVTTPTGWTLRESLTGAGGYGTTLGADTGNTNLYMYTKVAGVGDTGNFTTTIAGNNVTWSAVVRISNGGGTISYQTADGQQSTTPTASLSVSLASASISAQIGDRFISAMCIPTDVTTPSQFTNTQTTISGLTVTNAELGEADSSTGNDIGGFIGYSSVTAGTATGNPVFTATLAGTLTNVRGPVATLLVREVGGTTFNETITESATADANEEATETANSSQSETASATSSQDATYILGDASITETANALDAETASKEYNVDITESVTADATDDAAFIIWEDVAESVTATVTQDYDWTTGASATETAPANTAQTSQLDAVASRTETVTATETQSNTLVADAAVTESVAATEAETSALDVNADQTETVTATEASDTDLQYGVFQDESVTANTTQTNVLTARAWIEENDAGYPYLPITNSFNTNFTIRYDAARSVASTFIAYQSGQLGELKVRAVKSNTTTVSTFGSIELWQLSSNSITATPQTLIASVPVDLNVFSTTVSVQAYDFSGIPAAQLVVGVGYAVVISAGTDWLGTTNRLNVYADSGTVSTNYVRSYSVSFYKSGSIWLDNGYALNLGAYLPTTTLDSETVNVDWQVAQSESANALDSETAQFALSVDRTETVNATDSESAIAAMGVAQDETVTATDSETVYLSYTTDQTETVTATETETSTADYQVSRTETVTATETETTSVNFQASQTETVTATDSNVVYVSFPVAITETLNLTDSQSAVAELPAYITESVAANDEWDTSGDIEFTVTGVQANTFLGTASIATDQILDVTGLEVTGFVGTATAFTSVDVDLSGVFGTTQLGTADVNGDATASVSGVEAQSQLGTVALVTDNYIDVTGLQGTTQLGVAGAIVSIDVNLTGVQGTTQLGTVSIEVNADVFVSGVQADIILNKVNVWGNIVPIPTSPWNSVNDSQISDWVIIDKAS